jgi:hypothetical protein
MSSILLSGAQVLLAGNDDRDRGSPIGLFVILLLCIAVYILWKSLNKHLKRIPESFEPPVQPDDTAGSASAQLTDATPDATTDATTGTSDAASGTSDATSGTSDATTATSHETTAEKQSDG